MLEFYARDYLEIANRFGRVLAAGKEPDPDVLKDLWTDLYSDTERLELPVTREHIASLILELLEREPGKVDLSSGRFDVSASLSIAIIQPHVETIYKTLRAELGSLRLRVIPREKYRYCDPNWLTDGIVMTKYPETVDEFQRAGRCFAYGENTACVFHLMRVTEFYLKKIAESLQVPFHANTWSEIGKHITREMEKKHQVKTDA